MARILVIEDEADIRQVLDYNLKSAGHEVVEASRGADGLRLLREREPDLVLLDLMLPDMPGTEVCRSIKDNPATRTLPVVMLTARGEEIDRVVGFEIGADDYITKPFGMNELLARVRANLRRVPAENELDPVIEVGDFRIDTGAHKITVRHNEVRLTPKEFDLLVYMARRPGKVVNHRTLLAAIWGGQSTEQVEYLRVFVGQLRKKLEPDASSPRYIVTEPWVGYRFEPGE